LFYFFGGGEEEVLVDLRWNDSKVLIKALSRCRFEAGAEKKGSLASWLLVWGGNRDALKIRRK
jgi:hypothetical protein